MTTSKPNIVERIFTSAELGHRTTERRAVEAAIWGMPVINFDAMRQAFFRDAKAHYGDIMYWSRPGSWKLQCLTPNTSIRYVFSFTNSTDGPIVIELPATGDAALMGTLIDAWQVPQTDLGLASEDLGKGGKYLVLPPDFHGDVPAGFISVPMTTYNAFVGLRVIAKSEDEATIAKALEYLKRIRIYPLSTASAPPQTTFVDMADTVWDAVATFDESIFAGLARMVNEEPDQLRDVGRAGLLRSIGIEKGKPFTPDQAARTALDTAAREAHAWFMDRLVTFGDQFWPDGTWDIPVPPIGPKSGFTGRLMASSIQTRAALRSSASSVRRRSWAPGKPTSSRLSIATDNDCVAVRPIACACPPTCR